jgi:hypothetical protein
VVTLAAIGAEARQLRLGTALLTFAAWLLIGFGRALRWTLATMWISLAWTFVAIRTGWREQAAAEAGKRAEARDSVAQAARSGAHPDSGRVPVYTR